MAKKQSIFLLFTGVLFLFIISIASVLFYLRYSSTNDLAEFVADYREQANKMNKERVEDECNRVDERTRYENDQNMQIMEGFDLMRKSYQEEYNCYDLMISKDYLFMEDMQIKLRAINTQFTKYEEDANEIVDALEAQKPFLEQWQAYNSEYYSIEIDYVNCTENLYNEIIDASGSFKEGSSNETMEKGIENCQQEYVKNLDVLDAEYSNYEKLADEHTEYQEITRTLTKKINAELN